jgi:hypothetical protein
MVILLQHLKPYRGKPNAEVAFPLQTLAYASNGRKSNNVYINILQLSIYTFILINV